MAKQKKKKKHHRKAQGIMDRSDIPYVQRLTMDHRSNIVSNRDHAAKIAMYCDSIAMHELEGIGYKRLVHFHYHFKEVVDEFYKDGIDVGMDHAKRRLAQHGISIEGEFYSILVEGATKKEQEIQDNRLQAAQIALLCGAIAMNDEFGFGLERQERISLRARELSGKSDQFLLKEMEKIGFVIVDGEALAFIDDEGNPITYKQWKEMKGL